MLLRRHLPSPRRLGVRPNISMLSLTQNLRRLRWLLKDPGVFTPCPSINDSLSSPSESEREKGKLSGDEEQESPMPPKIDRLCPPEMFTKVITKSAKVMDLTMPAATPRPDTPPCRANTYPQGPTKPQVVPFPDALERVFATEWEHFNHSKQNGRLMDKLYTFPESVMTKLKVPSVDAPVVVVSSATILPSEGESGPKDACDRQVENSLKHSFESSSQSFRVAVTSSIFSRATYIWAQELAVEDKPLSWKARCTLKKIALASAAAADCTYDTLQLSSRSMTMGVLARRHIWLHQWEVDASSASRILNLPFKGEKLFGEALKRLLVENTEKQKVLPSTKKDPPKKTQSFHPSGSGFKPRGFNQ